MAHYTPLRIDAKQLRKVIDYLYDGHFPTHAIMLQINNNYARAHEVLLWLVRNKIRGARLVEFFNESRDDDKGAGVLQGVQIILNGIDGEIKPLTRNDLK